MKVIANPFSFKHLQTIYRLLHWQWYWPVSAASAAALLSSSSLHPIPSQCGHKQGLINAPWFKPCPSPAIRWLIGLANSLHRPYKNGLWSGNIEIERDSHHFTNLHKMPTFDTQNASRSVFHSNWWRKQAKCSPKSSPFFTRIALSRSKSK